MKKNRIFILGIVTMFVAILSLTLVSGTLARYTSSGTGVASVNVANWSVVVEDKDVAKNDDFTLSLFDTIYEYDTTSADVDVKDGLIAPGTQGAFDYTLTNDSEVTAKYSVVYTINEDGVPLEWSTDGVVWTDTLANVTAGDETKLAKEGGEATIYIYWRWAFDGDNDIDTNLGINGAEPTVTIQVTFDQVD